MSSEGSFPLAGARGGEGDGREMLKLSPLSRLLECVLSMMLREEMTERFLSLITRSGA